MTESDPQAGRGGVYRADANTEEPEVVLFSAVTGTSPTILGLLIVGPALLIAFGASMRMGLTMAIGGAPLVVAFVVLLALRQRVVIATTGVRLARVFSSRSLRFDAVDRVIAPDGAMAVLFAASSGSRAAASLLLGDVRGSLWALPSSVPFDVQRHVVREALPQAIVRATALFAGGGRYATPRGFSGIDATTLYGTHVGITQSPRQVSLHNVIGVDATGRVIANSAEPFFVATRDLVLLELLRRAGVRVEPPAGVAHLMP